MVYRCSYCQKEYKYKHSYDKHTFKCRAEEVEREKLRKSIKGQAKYVDSDYMVDYKARAKQRYAAYDSQPIKQVSAYEYAQEYARRYREYD